MCQRGRRDWPLGSGGCRPEDSRRPGAHHRPRGKGGALPGRILFMRNMTTPLGSGGATAGRPTVRKAEPPQRAQEDPRSERRRSKRRQETGNPCIGPSAEWLPHNWSDTGGVLAQSERCANSVLVKRIVRASGVLRGLTSCRYGWPMVGGTLQSVTSHESVLLVDAALL